MGYQSNPDFEKRFAAAFANAQKNKNGAQVSSRAVSKPQGIDWAKQRDNAAGSMVGSMQRSGDSSVRAIGLVAGVVGGLWGAYKVSFYFHAILVLLGF